MTDEGGLRDNVDGVKMAIDVTMNVLRNPDTAAPKFKIAASLHRCALTRSPWLILLICLVQLLQPYARQLERCDHPALCRRVRSLHSSHPSTNREPLCR
jgi:hypothetical protein